MVEARKLFGLDEKITVADRLTTIRAEYRASKVDMMGAGGKPMRGDGSVWVNIRTAAGIERFDISEEDFKALQTGA